MPRAKARGQLPSSYEMGFVVLDEDSTTAIEWLFTAKAIDAFPQLLALQEELFLNPAESLIPHGFRICARRGNGGTTYTPNMLTVDFCRAVRALRRQRYRPALLARLAVIPGAASRDAHAWRRKHRIT